jgi:hypothetical protein
VGKVSVNRVNGAVMLSTVVSESSLDFDVLIGSFLGLEDITLFSANQILGWTSIDVVLKRGSSENLDNLLVSLRNGLLHKKLISRTSLEVFVVPEEDPTVSGSGDKL